MFAKPVTLVNLSLDLSEPALAELVAQVLPLLDGCIREDVSAARYRALVADALPAVRRRGLDRPPRRRSRHGALADRSGHFNAWPDHCAAFVPASRT